MTGDDDDGEGSGIHFRRQYALNFWNGLHQRSILWHAFCTWSDDSQLRSVGCIGVNKERVILIYMHIHFRRCDKHSAQ